MGLFRQFRRMPGLLGRAIGAGMALAVLLWPALGQAQGAIDAIRIEGSQRIEPETVRSYMSVKPGDPYDAEKVNASLKSLFATGLFADVTLRREGQTLVVRVVENPIVNRVAFEGNRKIESKNLEGEISLRVRAVYTRTKVQNDTKRILDVYRRSGRFAATVEPKIIQLDQNRIDVVYEINEGPVTGVKAITFIGNKAYKDSKLRSIVQTKETAWYRLFSSDDNYDPDRLTFDRELLRRFYLREGYADFRVVSAVAELTPDRNDFFITFTVDEGERYKFGVVDLSTQFKNLDLTALRPSIIAQEGEWYNADLIEKTISKLTDAVGNLGYAFVDIQPTIDRDRDKKTINLTFDIQEGARVVVVTQAEAATTDFGDQRTQWRQEQRDQDAPQGNSHGQDSLFSLRVKASLPACRPTPARKLGVSVRQKVLSGSACPAAPPGSRSTPATPPLRPPTPGAWPTAPTRN